tara:strand:- start:21749 stop:22936 length:1188 start_codon:yes stop_codon:yes gene_type:complete
MATWKRVLTDADIGTNVNGQIGTDTDLDTSTAEVVDQINVTDGVISSMSKRTLTLANLGYTGATNANAYTHPTFDGDDINIDTGALTGQTVISDLDFNVTTNGDGHVTDANASIATRELTLSDLGYTGATNAQAGTVTSVGSGTGLTGTVTGSGSISLNFGALGTVTTWQKGDASNDLDSLIVYDDSAGAAKQAFFGDIPVSMFNNDANYGVGSGDITGVTITTDTGGASKMNDTGGSADFTIVGGGGVGVTNLGNTATVAVDTSVVRTSGTQTIAGNKSFSNNVVISGNLTVSGTSTSINTETIELADNNIVLNSNASGTPSEDCGITVERGSSSNVELHWDESEDYWAIKGTGVTARVMEAQVASGVPSGDANGVGSFYMNSGSSHDLYIRTA